MADTSIEWTDKTWNVVTGCDRTSPGCDHCYALTMAGRLKAMGNPKYQTDGNPRTSGPGFGVATHPDALTLPLTWRKPRRIFVNSMSDLFHDKVPDEFIARVFAVMALAGQHIFQCLTKRHSRMRSLLGSSALRIAVLDAAHRLAHGEVQGVDLPQQVASAFQDRQRAALRGDVETAVLWPLPNVHLGVSVENQQWADIRIPALLDTPAAVRWVSAEPLLGPVDLERWLAPVDWPPCWERHSPSSECAACIRPEWIVAGGESGPGARPAHPDWLRSLRDQCAAAGVPFHLKQWGEWGPAPWKIDREPGESDDDYKARSEALGATHGLPNWTHQYDNMITPLSHKPWSLERDETCPSTHVGMRRWGKKAAGRELDGQIHDAFPEVAP